MPVNLQNVKVFWKMSDEGEVIFGQVLGTQEELDKLITENGYADLKGAKSKEGQLRLPRIFMHNSWKAGKWRPSSADIPYIPVPIPGDVWLCNLNFSEKTGVLVAAPVAFVEFRGAK